MMLRNWRTWHQVLILLTTNGRGGLLLTVFLTTDFISSFFLEEEIENLENFDIFKSNLVLHNING